MKRILIVDDHPLVRAGFAQLIGDCPDLEVCCEAADMADALRQIDINPPDLAIIDRAIRQVLSGKVYLSEAMTDRMLNGMVDTRVDKRDIDSLSNRELQVFELIGQGLPVSQIANQLNLSIKTIETHQANIKKKLTLNSAHELNQRAIRWVMDQDSS
jgi:DNA-binding NarL/FixJ family response regulator